eukprot:COSAG01_NODE_20214_length_965_cov_1.336028_2_plen_197_part_01
MDSQETQVGEWDDAEQARVQRRRELFAALDPAVAVQLCLHAKLIVHIPTSETTVDNAIGRLAKLSYEHFNPVCELFKLPPEGVNILVDKWAVDVESTAAPELKHARVLISPYANAGRAHGRETQGKIHVQRGENVSGYGKDKTFKHGTEAKRGAGQLYWCRVLGRFFWGKTPQQHQSTPDCGDDGTRLGADQRRRGF